MIYNDQYIFVHVPKTGGQAVTKALGGRTHGVNLHRPLAGVDKGSRPAFGFIRNPWDRMVSLYSFMCQKRMRPTDSFNQDEVRAMGFKWWLMEYEFFAQEDYGEPLAMQRRSQMYWLEGCDYIGKFETLAEDLSRITGQIGINANPLEVVNKSNHTHYREYYDVESRRFVEKWFAEDLRFGYEY